MQPGKALPHYTTSPPLTCLAGDPAAASYLVQALWKLNRKQEAAAQWQKHLARPTGEDGQQEGQGRCVVGRLGCPTAANKSCSSAQPVL